MDLHQLRLQWATFTESFVTLLFIIDPFAAVPVFMTVTDRYSEEARGKIRVKASLIATAMLVVFALSGMGLFKLFGITMPAFQIAGGLLLLHLGVAQLSANHAKVTSAEQVESHIRDDVSIFPLATPILAGPGAISTVVLLSTKATSAVQIAELVAALACCMGATFGVLRSAKYLQKLLGTTGLSLLSRVMGIVLSAVAVQFILNGITAVWPHLGGH